MPFAQITEEVHRAILAEQDLITTAKSLAGGLPLSGVIGRVDIMDAPSEDSVAHMEEIHLPVPLA